MALLKSAHIDPAEDPDGSDVASKAPSTPDSDETEDLQAEATKKAKDTDGGSDEEEKVE